VHGFLENIKGIDFTRRVTMGIRNNRYNAEVPTVTGPLRRKRSIHGFEAEIARAHTRRRLKFTLPGPMTIVDTIADAHYGDKVALAMAFAALLNDEAHELAKIGVDVIQFDEPAFNVYVKEVTEWGIAALHRAAEGLLCKTAVHICYGYGIKANIDWKASLGAEWRQYEAIFPALATSRIDQVSVECAGAKVPIDLLGLLRGKEGAARGYRRRQRARRDTRGGRRDDRAGVTLCPSGAALSLHQLRHGADGSVARDQQTCRTQRRCSARPRPVRITAPMNGR
jgi:5-methyltetrahydropteroyltriglutamate--homocysteine methyltransferase